MPTVMLWEWLLVSTIITTKKGDIEVTISLDDAMRVPKGSTAEIESDFMGKRETQPYSRSQQWRISELWRRNSGTC